MTQLLSRKNMIRLMSAAAAIGFASAGHATVTLTSVGYDTLGGRTTTIAYSPTSLQETVGSGRFKISGVDNSTNTAVSYLAYCVDIFQFLDTGTFDKVALSSLPSQYAAKVNQVNALISHTTGITTTDQSAAVQLALWELVYEYDTNTAYDLSARYFTATGADSANARSIATTYLSNITSGIWGADSSYTLSVLQSDSKQDLLVWSQSAPVPEPATWAMFIGGFGLMGAAMRRSKTKVAFA